MIDDERAQWERQVADLAAKVLLLEMERDVAIKRCGQLRGDIEQLEQEREQARESCESAWYAIDQMEAEIHQLRRLAWDTAERLDAAGLDYALLADDLREQIAECERLRRTLADFYQARDEQVATLEQERDALRAAGSLIAGVLFDEGAERDEAKRAALAAWEALTHD